MSDCHDYSDIRNEFGRVLAGLVQECRSENHIGLAPNAAYCRLCEATECRGPLRLFKYSGVDDSRNLERRLGDIGLGRLHLSSPASFNDRFDARPWFDVSSFEDSISASMSAEVIEKSREMLLAMGAEGWQVDVIKGLIEDEGNREQLVGALADYSVRAIGPRFTSVRERARVASMCESVRSDVMWAHYASTGRGFAVEYEVAGRGVRAAWDRSDEFAATGFTLIPVQYCGRLDLTAFAPLFLADGYRVPEALEEPEYLAWVCAVACKKPDWESEREWRLACSVWPGFEGQLYARLEPKGLYAGWDASDDLVASLRDLAAVKRIPMYRMVADDSSREGNLLAVQELSRP